MTVFGWVPIATLAVAALAHLCALVWCGLRVSFFAGELTREVKQLRSDVTTLQQATRFNSLPLGASAMVGAQPFTGLNHG
jgi:hypothetical protein